MSSTLNVITFNVRGLGHPIKQKRVLTFLKKEKLDIAFLQETHLSNEEHKNSREIGSGKFIFLALLAIKGEPQFLFIKEYLSYLRSNIAISVEDKY